MIERDLDRTKTHTAKRTSRIIRAMRRKMGKTQIEMARLLGVSQGGLSKLESSLLVPTAPVWIHFCELAGVHPMSLQTGRVDGMESARLRSGEIEGGFALPERYQKFRGSKIRTAQPFLLLLEKMAGAEGLKNYLRYIGLESDFFVLLDNQINVNFAIDFFKHALKMGWLKADSLAELVATVAKPEAHGALSAIYRQQPDVSSLLKTLVENASKYETNFQYQIEDSSTRHLDLLVTPQPHLQEFHYKSDLELGDILCRFKKAYFESFSSYLGQAPWRIEERECIYQGGSKCVYHMTFDPRKES